MADDRDLFDVLTSLRDYGALGETSLDSAIRHADQFVAALPSDAVRLIDIGSGGGLPGLVVAYRVRAAQIVLCDRRERRCDLLRRAVARLGFDRQVTVVTADVTQMSKRSEYRHRFDACTSRAFGPPLWTLECARPFLREGGSVIVSEPPGTLSERWPLGEVENRGFVVDAAQFDGVRRFTAV
jgi:16S rRNA G527 N7-methylase RsmG